MAVMLRKRLTYELPILARAFAIIAGLVSIVVRLVLGSSLVQSATGRWMVWTALALAVAGVMVVVGRRLRLAGPVLSDQGLAVRDEAGPRTLAWSNLASVTTKTRTTMGGAYKTIELGFRGQPPAYLDDKFTLKRDDVIELIRERASAAGAAVVFNIEHPAARVRFERTAMMALATYGLMLLLAIGMALGFALLGTQRR